MAAGVHESARESGTRFLAMLAKLEFGYKISIEHYAGGYAEVIRVSRKSGEPVACEPIKPVRSAWLYRTTDEVVAIQTGSPRHAAVQALVAHVANLAPVE